jgi:hypothetical protein
MMKHAALFAFLFFAIPKTLFSAIPNDAIWEVRPTNGDDTNGACVDESLVASTTDYSQQNAAQLSLTDLATTGATVTTLTSATGGFTAAMVGNCIRINSGTNAKVGYYVITAYTDTNTVTLDSAPDNGVGGVADGAGKVGGAAKSIASQATPTLAASTVNSNIIYVKNEASWSENITIAGWQQIIGYNSSRGDNPTGANRPTLDLNSGAGDAITVSTGNLVLQNLIIREAGGDGIGGGGNYQGTAATLVNVKVTNNGGHGLHSNGFRRVGFSVFNSELDNNTANGINVYQANNEGYARVFFSEIYGNTTAMGGGVMHSVSNLIYDNSAVGISSLAGAVVINNTIDGNTGATTDGITLTSGENYVVNNISSNNGRYGIRMSAESTLGHEKRHMYNNYYNNGTANVSNIALQPTEYELDPQFTDADNEDFSIGTNLKAKGFGAYPSGTTTGYMDIGAVQRQESSGGSGGSFTYVG